VVVGQTGEYVDILVLGGGPGGYSAAIRAAQLGRSVALVERDRVGGVCLNEGCIPSKALLNASRLFRGFQDAAAMGIDASPRLDFGRMCRWKEGLVQRLSAGVTELLQRYDVRVKSGTAHFASNHRVSVDRVTDFEFVDFGTAIIATGSRALGLENFETDGTQIISPESALAVDTLPGRLGIVGGGYVALELATAFGRLGTKVTVVVPEERILPEVDAVLAQVVSRRAKGRIDP
jgi:dihydrolipoamide dehydrogenase